MARILVADDEESIRSLVARALGRTATTVATACDGAEALELLDTGADGAFELLLDRHSHAGDGWHRAGADGGTRPSRRSRSC